jgi:hypothetical protein
MGQKIVVVLEWFNAHDRTVVALATLVLVIVTGWGAWTTPVTRAGNAHDPAARGPA